jgi:predicted transcriptional regulator
VEKIKKLPDAEFDIMKVVWANVPPITTSEVMKQLGNEKEWKIQTVVSLMLRLSSRGFLRSEKHGKERTYFPLVGKDAYLKFETDHFLKHIFNNSFLDLVTTLYDDKALSGEDIESIDELLKWTRERRRG